MNEYGFSQGIARNASQSEYPNLWRGLVGLWVPSAGNQGNKLVDFACGRTGTLTNSPLWYPGRRGTALKFDGVNDYVDIGAVSALNSASRFTIMYWVKKNAAGNSAEVGSRIGSTDGFWLEWFSDGNIYFSVRNGGTNTSSVALSYTSKWYHLCGVFDGSLSDASRAKIYVNGIPANYSGASNPTSVSSTVANSFQIAALTSASIFSAGLFDDVRIYNRALSAAEIMHSYMGASPLVRAVQTYGKSVSAALPRKTRMLFA